MRVAQQSNPVPIAAQNAPVTLGPANFDTKARKGGCGFQVQNLAGAAANIRITMSDGFGLPVYTFTDTVAANSIQAYDCIMGTSVNPQLVGAAAGSIAQLASPTVLVAPRDPVPQGDVECGGRQLVLTVTATSASPNLLVGPPIFYEF